MPPGAGEGVDGYTRGDQTTKIPFTAWEEALKKSIDNLLGVRILHTPEEAHELIAEKERNKRTMSDGGNSVLKRLRKGIFSQGTKNRLGWSNKIKRG